MGQDIPPAPPEAEVIRLAREATGMTAQSAAEASKAQDSAGRGVSPAYWRDVERGHGGRRGERVPTRASARVLAAMARVVGVEPGQLTGAGREDAARVLGEMLRRESRPVAPAPTREPDAAALAALDLGRDVFVDMTPELRRNMESHLAEIRGRVALLAGTEARARGVPLAEVIDRIPAGKDVFPDSDADAGLWDRQNERGFLGERYTVRQLIAAVAVIRAREEERQQHGQGNGIAAGLIPPLIRA